MESLKFSSPFLTADEHIVSHNPNFYQAVTMDIEIIRDDLVPPPTIIILLKHQRYNSSKRKSEMALLGRYWMSLDMKKNVWLKDKQEGETFNFVFQRPSWIPMIYDKKEKEDGRILLSYTLIELEDLVTDIREEKRNQVYGNVEEFCKAVSHGYLRDFEGRDKYPLMAEYHMWPESNRQELNIFMMGFRNVDLKKKMEQMSCVVRIHGVINKYEQGFRKALEGEEAVEAEKQKVAVKAKKGEEPQKQMSKIRRLNQPENEVETNEEGQEIDFALNDDLNTIVVNRILKVNVEVPNVEELAPIMEVFLFEGQGPDKKLLSTGNLNMKRAFAYYYGVEDNIDYKDRIMEFMKIRAVGSNDQNELKPHVKVKVPRVRAQNKMNYFGINYVVEMPDIKKAMIKENEKGKSGELQVRTENIVQTEGVALHDKEDFAEDFPEQDAEFPGQGVPVGGGQEGEEEVAEMKGAGQVMGRVHKKVRAKVAKRVDKFMRKIAIQQNQQEILGRKHDEENQELLQKNKHVKAQFERFHKHNEKGLNTSFNEFADDEDDAFNKIDVNAIQMNGAGLPKKKAGGEAEGEAEADPEADPEARHFDTMDQEDEEKLNELRVDRDNFSFTSEQIKEFNEDVIKEEIENLQIGQNKIKKFQSEISPKAVKYADEFVEENEDAKAKRRKEMRNKFLRKFKMKGGLKSFFRKMKKKMGIEYVEFDTDDDEEDLNEVLPFLKGRYEYNDDLEDLLFPEYKIRNIAQLKMFRGSERQSSGGLFSKLLGGKMEERKEKGLLKLTFYRNDEVMNTDKIKSFMTKLTKPRKYIVRAYILKGKKMSGIQVDDESLKTFIRVTLNKSKASISTGSESKQEGFYPEYYEAFEFRELEMPGTATLEIEVWESTLIGNSILGTCHVDLEDRIFNTRWTKWEDRPVENRAIVNKIHGVRGRLQMWIDIFPEGDKTPMVPIFPIERLPFELRAIVWSTRDCVIKDTIAECNDVFVRGGVMRGNQFVETDTHWRCRTDGSFNYRWKYDITLPVEEERNYGEDRFKLQVWDRDLIMANDLIGETEIDLNMHKMLKKAYKRKEPVEMRMKISGSGVDTNQIYFDVFHPEVIDDFTGAKITQGKVLMSFEVLPKENADNLKNEFGRKDPNFFPTLPQPVGRFSFDIFSPCETIKQIIGPKLCYQIIYAIICIFLCVVIVFVGYFVFTTFIGVSISNAIIGR